MKASEKAEEIIASIVKEISFNGQSKRETLEDAKNIALICVNQIIEAVEDVGREFDELQNMDSNIRYWELVKTKISE